MKQISVRAKDALCGHVCPSTTFIPLISLLPATDNLEQLLAKEREQGIQPDVVIDAYMKASAAGKAKHSIVVRISPVSALFVHQ